MCDEITGGGGICSAFCDAFFFIVMPLNYLPVVGRMLSSGMLRRVAIVKTDD
jgi:hypothetical protein